MAPISHKNKRLLLRSFALVTFAFGFIAWQHQFAEASANGVQNNAPIKKSNHYLKAGVTAAKLLTRLGYTARDLEFTTRDGYILNIVRATNPLFSNNGTNSNSSQLYPILFVHGSLMGASTMLGNLADGGVEPRDFRTKLEAAMKQEKKSKIAQNAKGLDVNERMLMEAALLKIVGEDPSQKSLPLMALNLGYEIWLLNRRGAEKSRAIASGGGGTQREKTLLEVLIELAESLGLKLDSWPLVDTLVKTFAADSSFIVKYPFLAGILEQIWFHLGGEQWAMKRALGGRFMKQIIQTLDTKYWSSSLDEHIAYDIPQAVDFVLSQTGKQKVHTVGYSSGGAIILLAASESHSEKLTEKVASTVLWSPAVSTGVNKTTDMDFLTSFISRWPYIVPVPFVFMREKLIHLLQSVCSHELVQRTICARALDFLLGFSGFESPLTPSVLAGALQPTSSRELSHLFQFLFARPERGGPCKFRFNTADKNIQTYGQREPPCYNLSRVNLTNLSIYVGAHDTLISPVALKKIVSQLKVPTKFKVIDGAGVYFNHAGPILHDDTGHLLVVPSLLDIESVERNRLLLKNHGAADNNQGSCRLDNNDNHHNSWAEQCVVAQ